MQKKKTVTHLTSYVWDSAPQHPNRCSHRVCACTHTHTHTHIISHCSFVYPSLALPSREEAMHGQSMGPKFLLLLAELLRSSEDLTLLSHLFHGPFKISHAFLLQCSQPPREGIHALTFPCNEWGNSERLRHPPDASKSQVQSLGLFRHQDNTLYVLPTGEGLKVTGVRSNISRLSVTTSGHRLTNEAILN